MGGCQFSSTQCTPRCTSHAHAHAHRLPPPHKKEPTAVLTDRQQTQLPSPTHSLSAVTNTPFQQAPKCTPPAALGVSLLCAWQSIASHHSRQIIITNFWAPNQHSNPNKTPSQPRPCACTCERRVGTSRRPPPTPRCCRCHLQHLDGGGGGGTISTSTSAAAAASATGTTCTTGTAGTSMGEEDLDHANGRGDNDEQRPIADVVKRLHRHTLRNLDRTHFRRLRSSSNS